MNFSKSKYYWYVIPSENRKHGIYCDSGKWQEFRFTTDADWDFGNFTTTKKWLARANTYHRKIHSGELRN